MPPKEKDPETPADGPDAVARQRRRQAANGRVRAAERAVRQALRDGPMRRETRRGTVTVLAVEVTTEDGMDCLEVHTEPGNGETHFRIFNPPTGVRQPDGTVIEDPIGALAETLAMHVGTERKRRIR